MAKINQRALVLFSGGLDSRLVVKLLQEQNLEVELLFFKLPFGCGCSASENESFAKEQRIELTLMDCTKGELLKDYLQMLKHPKHGRGSSMNPCIDCKIFMFRKAKEYADKNKISIIATGEVLGERPMSQTTRALKIIDEELNFEILRPLSAKLLKETQSEKEKLVDRDKFLDIQGRSRKTQIELAKKFNIKFPTPGGGCLLCEKAYKPRIQHMIRREKSITPAVIKSLETFRHFASDKTGDKIILGRNEQENKELEALNRQLGWSIIIPKSPGPIALYENQEDSALAEEIVKAYSSKNLEERKKFEERRI